MTFEPVSTLFMFEYLGRVASPAAEPGGAGGGAVELGRNDVGE